MGAASVKMRTALAIAALKPCLLCAAQAAAVGVYEPARGHRLFVYSICADCLADDAVRENVEQRLAA